MGQTFHRFRKALQSTGDSTAAMACALGAYEPLRPMPKTEDLKVLSQWFNLVCDACSNVLQSYVPSHICVAIDRSTTSNSSHCTMLNSDDLMRLDPHEVVDYACGRIIRHSAAPFCNVGMLRAVVEHVRDAKPMRPVNRAHKTMLNVLSSAHSVHEALRRYKGWAGMIQRSPLQGDFLNMALAEMREFVANEEVPLIMRAVAVFTAKLHGFEIVLEDKAQRVIDKAFDNKKAPAYSFKSNRTNAEVIDLIDSLSQDLVSAGYSPDYVVGVSTMNDSPRNPADYWGAIPLMPEEKSDNQGGKSEDSEDQEKKEDKRTEEEKKRQEALKQITSLVDKSYTPAAPAKKHGPVQSFRVAKYMGRLDPPPSWKEELLAKARVYMPALKGVAFRVSRPPKPVYGYRSGALDENSLHKAPYDDKVFHKPPTEDRGRVEMTILIDSSGSMGGDRIETAKALAYAMSQTFTKIADIKIYSHSGYSTICNIVEWTPDSLGALHAGSENADGFAIKWCAEELLSRGLDKRKVLIQIADGQPSCGCYGGDKAIAHVAEQVRIATKKGVTMCTIGLDNCISDAVGRFMYGKRFFNTYTHNMPRVLSRLVGEILGG